jgi:hypothetical protein
MCQLLAPHILTAVAERMPFCPEFRLISDEAETAGQSTPKVPLVVCFAGSFAVGEHGLFDFREEVVSGGILGGTLGCRQVTHLFH